MNINQIIEKFKSDTAFAEKYSALTSVEAVLEQAKADGFEVTAADVEAAITQLGQKTGELSEDDLAVVAGGKDEGVCFFYPSTEPAEVKVVRDGATRTKCKRGTCMRVDLIHPRCKCFGSHTCVDAWHFALTCDIAGW